MTNKNFYDKQKDTIQYIDIFEKTGEPVKRIYISDILSEHGLTMLNITHVVVPRLEWSARNNVQQLMAMAAKQSTGESNGYASDSDDNNKKNPTEN